MTDSYPRTDLIPDQEYWVQILSERPDDLGREMFMTYWADGNQWRGGHGISAQVFFTRLDTYRARREKLGWTVRVITTEQAIAVLLAAKPQPTLRGTGTSS